MKKYIKPTANIVELSVKESLSALPGGFVKPGATTRNDALKYVATTYSYTGSNPAK